MSLRVLGMSARQGGAGESKELAMKSIPALLGGKATNRWVRADDFAFRACANVSQPDDPIEGSSSWGDCVPFV